MTNYQPEDFQIKRYGKSFSLFINWSAVTEHQFKTDWESALQGNPLPENKDRALVALLKILAENKLQQLLISQINHSLSIDYALLTKALLIPAVTDFFTTGNFVLLKDQNLKYLNILAESKNKDAYPTLFAFYHKHRKTMSDENKALFLEYVREIENEKLKNSLLEFIKLNEGPSDVYIPEQVDSNEIKELEQQLDKLEEASQDGEVDEHERALPSTPQPIILPTSLQVSERVTQRQQQQIVRQRMQPIILESNLSWWLQAKTSWNNFVNKWKALPTRYKVMAGVTTFLGLSTIVLGAVFPPSLVVTVPLLKISSSALLTYAGAALTGITLIGHAIHINRQSPVTISITERPQPESTTQREDDVSIHGLSSRNSSPRVKQENAEPSASPAASSNNTSSPLTILQVLRETSNSNKTPKSDVVANADAEQKADAKQVSSSPVMQRSNSAPFWTRKNTVLDQNGGPHIPIKPRFTP